MAHFNPGSRYHHELPCKINGNGKWQSCSTAPLTALSVSQPYFFLTSGANFQKTQPPPNLSLLISPAGTCQQPGQHTACRKRRERINEDCFRREQFSPRINLSWKCSLYEAPFPLLKGHPALLQEAPCFFLNALLWDTSLFLPQICGFIQSKKSDGKKKKKASQTCSSLWNQNRRFSALNLSNWTRGAGVLRTQHPTLTLNAGKLPMSISPYAAQPWINASANLFWKADKNWSAHLPKEW